MSVDFSNACSDSLINKRSTFDDFMELNDLVRYCHFGVSPVNYSDSEITGKQVGSSSNGKN